VCDVPPAHPIIRGVQVCALTGPFIYIYCYV
jgi:hypothetical protein